MKNDEKRVAVSFKEFKRNALLGKRDSWLDHYITRKFSTRISWGLLQIYPKITPNQVSTIGFLIGFSGTLFFLFGATAIDAVVGAIILFLWLILDRVDGEIARFRKMKSITGLFLELSYDFLIMPLIFIALSVFLYNIYSISLFLIVGLFVSFSISTTRLIIANQYWALFMTGKCRTEINPLNEKEVKEKYMFVNEKVVSTVKFFMNLQFLLYSDIIVYSLLLISIIQLTLKPNILILNIPFDGFSLFLGAYLALLPYTIFLIIFHFLILRISDPIMLES